MGESPESLKLPSGYELSSTLAERAVIDSSVLPWLNVPVEMNISECTLQSGETFLLASVLRTHPKLVKAAEGMTESQVANTDNMFYSRVPTVISQGYSPSVETLPDPVTEFPISVMRNKGGQRVYFARTSIKINGRNGPDNVILRLGVCDKNRQGLVMSVLSSLSDRQTRRKLSK